MEGLAMRTRSLGIANDDIPEDEALLAEAIAAAKARNLGHSTWRAFVPDQENAVACCAVGALVLAGKTTLAPEKQFSSDQSLWGVTMGNDFRGEWTRDLADHGESLGWAFRCFFTQDEE
jgi:hypothetical protein